MFNPRRTLLAAVCLASGWGLALVGAARGQGLDGILAPVKPTSPAVDANPKLASRTAPAVSRAPSTMRLGDEELCERLASLLVARLALTDGDLTLSPALAWTPLDLPAGTWDAVLLDAPNSLDKLSSSFSLRFRIEASGKPVGEWRLPVRAQLMQDVWAATRRLVRGESPSEADMEKRRIDVLSERQPPVPAKTNLANYEMAQTVAAGQTLTLRDLGARTLVHRGQTVDVIAADGKFSISMKALATQDGAEGALIRVRNTASLRDFDAEVVSENKVRVRF